MTNLDADLSPHQARMLGCLLEKQLTTPDYYPLTLKALTAACNQKSNRVPVLKLSDSEVGGVVQALRNQGLITARTDGRADRFEQQLSRKLKLSRNDRAIMSVLMLRAALTLNEIRIHTSRMTTFDSNEALQGALDALMGRDTPLIMRIPRAAGQREDRYAHLLCGKETIDIMDINRDISPHPSSKESDRIRQLELDVAELQAQVANLFEQIQS